MENISGASPSGPMYLASLHGPMSDKYRPPAASSTSDLPPNLDGKFSAGICFSSSLW